MRIAICIFAPYGGSWLGLLGTVKYIAFVFVSRRNMRKKITYDKGEHLLMLPLCVMGRYGLA